MTENPLDVLMAGFIKVNSIPETSVLNKSGAFKDILNLWKKAEQKYDSDQQNMSLMHNVGAYFIELYEYELEHNRYFEEKFKDVTIQQMIEVWQVLEEYYEYKYTFLPKTKDEIKLKISRIV